MSSFFSGPQAVVLVLAIALALFWKGSIAALLPLLIMLPVLTLLPRPPRPRQHTDTSDWFMADDELLAQIDLRRHHSKYVVCCAITLEGPNSDSLRAVYLHHVRQAMRPGDLATIGKDNKIHLVFAPAKAPDRSGLGALATRMQRRLEEPVIANGHMHHMSAAVGIASAVQIGAEATAEKILALARLAGDQAVAQARSAIVIANPDGQHRPPTPSQLLQADAALRAIELGRITPWFQPMLDCDTGRVSGAEVLARWTDPAAGLVAPASFLPALNSQGLLPRLTDAMAQQAAQALADWDHHGIDVPSLNLNPCDDDFLDPGLAKRLLAATRQFRLAPDRLRVDLHMRQLTHLPRPALRDTLSALTNAGIPVDLEGVDATNAKTADIAGLGLSRLKLDRTIVARAERSESQRRSVATVLALAQRHGLQTVACGIESHGEHEIIAQLGCNHAMGYCIARPMPAKALPEWHADHTARLETLLQVAHP